MTDLQELTMYMHKKRHRQLVADICQHINDAERYASYSAMVARRFDKKDTFTKWLVAVAACGPFIDKLTIESVNTAAWIIALIPLISIALPLLNYSKKIELASTIHSQYVGILPALRDLWRKACSSEAPSLEELNCLSESLGILEEKISDIRSKKSEMPVVPSLADKAKSEARLLIVPDSLMDNDYRTYDDLEANEAPDE